MAIKNALIPHVILSAGDMSSTTLTSDVTNIQYLDNISILLTFTGTPTGTFTVVGGHSKDTTKGVTITLPNPATCTTAGSILIDLNQMGVPYIWVVYTKGSGIGRLTVSISGKEV